MRDKTTGRIGRERYQFVLSAIQQGQTAVQIAEALSVNQETVRKFARNRNLCIQKVDQSMEKHPAWRSGEVKDRSGYLLRRVLKDGPYGYLIRAIQKRGKLGTDRAGYAPVHRISAHDMLGRKLHPNEVVDHIDGDLENNHPSNLRVFQSNADHLRNNLTGKVPNWTPEGYARMCDPRLKHRGPTNRPGPTPYQTKIDGLG